VRGYGGNALIDHQRRSGAGSKMVFFLVNTYRVTNQACMVRRFKTSLSDSSAQCEPSECLEFVIFSSRSSISKLEILHYSAIWE